ncbi:TonB-dependent receptor [Chitinophaga parva]|uniref:TonB-dependent receptor n=1 Tax=Chitinophaga parva TaxID=2169414 RepID=A0A2T7BG09_9BACT|nr:TonB-dependent receptor [Chitinophaga parva]PUZ25221.1 TonB-dependent receptor [Chitinophaga parva]
MKPLLALCLLLIPISVGGQGRTAILDQQVTFDINAGHLEDMATQIRQQTQSTCYYIPEIFDTLSISLKGKMKIRDAFEKIFPKSSHIYVNADPNGNIYITHNQELSMTIGQKGNYTSKGRPRKAPAGKGKYPTAPPGEVAPATKSFVDFDENKLFTVGTVNNNLGYATIIGYVRHRNTGEGVGHASIYISDIPGAKAMADSYGYFTITLPKGRHTLMISCVGLSDARRQIDLRGNGQLNVLMHEFVTSLRTVTVGGGKTNNINSPSMSVNRMDIKTIRQIPALLGEVDVLRAVQTLPGVTAASEGTTGLNVRGGNVDQNLVLLDGATVYNPSHFFGFFSGFNSDLIKDAELYKASIPVRYGSRLSSVLEVLTREGNNQRFAGSGGIGPLSAHLTLEGPIGRKTTLLVGGRTTYADWTLKLLPDQYQDSHANFYDVNLKLSSELDEKNNIYVSLYNSGDRFKLNGDTLYRYGNINGVLKWRHLFNNKLYGNFSAGADNYQFAMSSTALKLNAFRYKFDVSQFHANADLVYTPNNQHRIEMGFSSLYYKLHPGSLEPLDSSLALEDKQDAEQALESALYISDQYTINDKWSVEAGLRYSMFNYLGPHVQYNYPPGLEKTEANLLDSTTYGTGKLIKTYHGPEPRVSLRYKLGDNSSLKVAYNRTRQYIHLLTNTTVVSPTDTWKLSDKYIQPQTADQVSLGLYKNLHDDMYEVSVEGYYKRLQHALTYKNGAVLLLNHHIETDVANAVGKAYGVEFLLKKSGKLNGWISYTYSRTLLRMDDPQVADKINGGQYYPADYDKPHVLNVIANYRFSHRAAVSLTSFYSTGRPITLPVARYYYQGSYRVYYEDRNQYRIPDYFRTDLSVNLEGNHKIKKLGTSSWTLGVYNLFARRNAYSVYFVSENGKTNGYKLSIFGTAIPFVTYNFKF